MTVLKYKDFQGSVSFEDGTLVLQILNIDDLIVAECDSASKVEQTFQELVDDYLETCAAAPRAWPSPLRHGPLRDRQGRTPGLKGAEWIPRGQSRCA